MSLKLDPVTVAPPTPQVAPVVDRCAGLTWAASLGVVCNSDTFATAPARVAVAVVPAASEATDSAPGQAAPDEDAPAAGATFSGSGLTTLGFGSTTGRLLRAAREIPAEAGKAFELLFRFASKYRLTSTGEGWEVTKFKDVMSENRTQASGVKAVGVELMLPFQ
jgi:hypothetical protein